jgi:23S rRNA (guanine2445-N2)-methyltransferase / 23S rRNA (guanine2069-N7)-methyltransferase
MGEWMKSAFPDYRAAVLTAGKEAAKYLGLRADRVYSFYNGNVKAALGIFELTEDNRFHRYTPGPPGASPADKPPKITVSEDETSGVKSVANRIGKNRRTLRKYLKNRGIRCYRVYDADIPQYAAAVDVYEDTYFVIQEYAPPKTVDPEKARYRLGEITEAVIGEFGADRRCVFVKQRRRQKGKQQYGKHGEGGEFYVVGEGGLKFFVNFTDYLDTGLFLDHRITRDMIRTFAGDRRVLNLFAYTCTASVYAADGGARHVDSVDTANTYLEWGKKNFGLNKIPLERASFIRSDALEFLRERAGGGESYGLIFIDPPSFSNRKDSPEDFDVQGAHEELIERAWGLLERGGRLIFSTNYRDFEMSARIEAELPAREITAETIPKDFERNRKIHRAWIMEK